MEHHFNCDVLILTPLGRVVDVLHCNIKRFEGEGGREGEGKGKGEGKGEGEGGSLHQCNFIRTVSYRKNAMECMVIFTTRSVRFALKRVKSFQLGRDTQELS